ncbi:MAG: hypothetical protein FJ263_07135 [Planctomycetes bacterium]|nr:hypothetical protein [Planctomycetota bacterium]
MSKQDVVSKNAGAAMDSIVSKYISDNYVGDDLDDKDRICLGQLLAVVEKTNFLFEQIRRAADAVSVGMAMFNKHHEEYTRLSGLGLLKAAAAAAEPIPRIIDNVKSSRRQLRETTKEMEHARDGFIKASGLLGIQAQYRQAATDFERIQRRMCFLENAANYCQKQNEMIEANARQLADEAENSIKIPHFNDLPENS